MNEQQQNLKLIINNQKWQLVIRNEPQKSYYDVNSKERIVYINNYDIDDAKLATWRNYDDRKT